jgi:signal transduction histidine kinase
MPARASRETLTCVVSPNPGDAELALAVLQENGIDACAFPSLRELAFALDERAGCLIVVEEALIEEDVPVLRHALEQLPQWSDPPLILVARDVGALGYAAAQAFPTSGNVTLLERPLNPHTLVSAVFVALRSALRQRQVGELIAQREQAVRARDEFLAMLAHELRNPLAPMLNALYLLRGEHVDEALLAKGSEILERQVHHVVRMVDDLMDVARLERGKVVLKKQRLDLNRAVASAVDTCLPAAHEKGHRITVRYGADRVPVDGDPVRVEQIICNLINNAAKFSPVPGEIRVETFVDPERALIAVEDQGVGFEEDAAERLFEPFLQVNPTLERTVGGLGMGLTIVRRLVELHGGSVRAASEGPGKGSRFVVGFPLASGSEAPTAEPVAPRANAGRRRIVVIEDNADIRETVRLMLTAWGHDVSLAADGLTGVELVLKSRPDVALIDVGLPGLNGYDVARAIRKRSNGAIRLIAVTGYGQPSDRELALQAGFDSHVLKPVSPEVLQKLLSE